MMLHCFYDAPHIYKDCLFEDFNEWVEFIFSRVEEMNVDLVVKPHPSPKPLNSVILEKLFTKYPNIRVLDKNTSNDVNIIFGAGATSQTTFGICYNTTTNPIIKIDTSTTAYLTAGTKISIYMRQLGGVFTSYLLNAASPVQTNLVIKKL